MKKLLAFLVALTMILGVARPIGLFAEGEENPFDDDFPIDIPFPG